MAEDKPEQTETAPEFSRPKRTPPTIDLEASEISREPDAAAASDAEPAATDSPQTAAPEPQRRSSLIPSALVAAVVGALAGGGAIGTASWLGWPAPVQTAPAAPQIDRAAVDALAARVAAVETKAAAASKPVPPAVDDKLTGRVDAVEQALGGLRKDLAALQEQIERSRASIDELKSAPRESAVSPPPAPDLSPLTARLDQIETTTRALSAAAQRNAAAADDKPLRRVVAATMLDQLVRQGESYAAALTAAKPLAGDAATLKPLDRFAQAGVPSANALCKQLLTLIAGLAPTEARIDEGTGIVERLKAGAERLVRIRRTGPQSGESRDAVLSRAAAFARLDDVAAAKREVNTLAAADRAPLQPWIEQADARDAALMASRQFASDATAALGKSTP
jgi:hypothetical protein